MVAGRRGSEGTPSHYDHHEHNSDHHHHDYDNSGRHHHDYDNSGHHHHDHDNSNSFWENVFLARDLEVLKSMYLSRIDVSDQHGPSSEHH